MERENAENGIPHGGSASNDNTIDSFRGSPIVGYIVGEVSKADIIMPYMGIAQKVGGLGEMFEAGHVILNKEVDLTAAAPILEVTVLGARKQYVENLPFDSGERPRYCDSEDEVAAMGGTTEWRDGVPPTFVPLLTAQVLLRIPDGLERAYPLEFKGKSYSLAQWTLRNTAYKSAGRSILSASALPAYATCGLHHAKWELMVEKQKFGRNTVFVPKMRLMGKHDAEFVEFAAGLLG